MRKKLAGVGFGLVGALGVAAGALYFLIFAGTQGPAQGVALPPGAEAVVDGYSTMYLFGRDPTSPLVLIDAGKDVEGKALKQALANRHRQLADIAAVFVTHAHGDHVAAIPLLSKAAVYTLAEERPQADGTGAFHSPVTWLMGLGARNPHPFTVSRGLTDGEQMTFGGVTVTTFALPGHTAGSAAYLVDGVLVFGDAAYARTNGTLQGPLWIFSDDRHQGLASLKSLAIRLSPQADSIQVLATAHSGTLAGFAPLAGLAGR